MKILISIFVIVGITLNSLPLYSQQSSLYLVMAYIDKDNQSDYYQDASNLKTYYKLLYKWIDNDLVLVDTLNATDEQYMERLIHFPDQHLFYYVESSIDILKNDSYYFSMFDYQNDELVFRRYYTDWDTLWTDDSYNYYGFSFTEDNRLYIVNEDVKDEKSSSGFSKIGIDRYFNRTNAGYNEYNNLCEFGISGFQDGFYNSVSFPWGNTLLLKITWDSDYDKMGNFKYQLPEEFVNEKESIFQIVINNDHYLLLSCEYRTYVRDTMKKVYLYDKKNNAWEDIILPGNSVRVRNWKDWLYGMELRFDSSVFSKIDYKLYKDKVYQDRDRLMKKYNLQNGEPPSLIDMTGRMYLYNIPFKKLIVWQTKDKDSEIIQVIDGTVYYRVFDELRKVKIDERRQIVDWKSDVLLIKNKDIIPYVHNIFFSSTTQTKCKEIWVNNPNKGR